jgi:hypothetical protein
MGARSRLRLASLNIRRALDAGEYDEDQLSRLRDAREAVENIEAELRELEKIDG